jgi:HlyD family secretion protein
VASLRPAFYDIREVVHEGHRMITRRRLRWFLLLLVTAVAAIAVIATKLRGPPVAVVNVARGDLLQTVVASGRVRIPARIEIGTLVLGQVTARLVESGDRVSAGQVLLQLDDREARALLDQANATVEQARARLRQIAELGSPTAEQSLREAQARYTQAERQYRRSQQLQKNNLVSESKVDDDRVAFQVAQTQLESARLQAQSNRTAGPDYAVAQTALNQALASLNVAQTRLDYTVIKAPTAGVVMQRNVEAGDIVQAGVGLITLAGDGESEIVADVDERNLRLLENGQHAQVAADAFPERQFAARLWFIAPAVDANKGSVEIRLRVPTPPHYLRPDMTVSVEIEIARRSATLVAPAAVARDAATDAAWVLRVRDGVAQRTAVRLGAMGIGSVEFLAGVEAGDALILSSDTRIDDGQRVRAVLAKEP